jgi:hypothetical protein
LRILLEILLQRRVCLRAVDSLPASKAPQLSEQLADVVASVRSAVMTVTMRLHCPTHRAEDNVARQNNPAKSADSAQQELPS